MANEGSLASFVRAYLQRVVNEHDLTAVEALVSPGYTGSGHGWPANRSELEAFYAWQARTRPDWRVEVQGTLEVGECVVVRAHAGGTVTADEPGLPLAAPRSSAVEWLAAYCVSEGMISRIDLLAVTAYPGWH